MDRLVAPGREWTAERFIFTRLRTRRQTPVTDDWYRLGNVTFSDDGKYLMLSLGRDFKPIFGEEEFDNVYRDMERVYLVTLAKDTESPLGRGATKSARRRRTKTKKDGREEGRRQERREERTTRSRRSLS